MKRHAPATARNSGPLADVLAGELPDRGRVLEIASGSGEHAVFFARRFPRLLWQPSDLDPDALASIDAWAAEAGLGNLGQAIALDAAEPDWDVGAVEAILCVNMIHISPASASEGLFRGASMALCGNAPLIFYDWRFGPPPADWEVQMRAQGLNPQLGPNPEGMYRHR